jgi:carboxypeptidase family protein
MSSETWRLIVKGWWDGLWENAVSRIRCRDNVPRLLAIVFALSALGAVPAQGGTIHGMVVDSNGAVIRNAYVIIHADGAGQDAREPVPDTTLRTDKAGRFAIDARPGFYDICILADAFTPTCYKTFITEGSSSDRRTKLLLNSAVIQRLGDTFPRK